MTIMVGHVLALAALVLAALQALANLLTVPRLAGLRPARTPGRIAVLVPARNEAGRIGDCLRAWARQEYPDYEVVVLDDDSTDATAAEAAAAARGQRHVRVLRGGALGEGWRGKPWACERLRRETEAPFLVFADADVIPAPGALARVAAATEALGADLLSVLPRHEAGPAVGALAGLQQWAALTFVPSWCAALRRRRLFAVANGQLLAIRASTYDAAGGFAAVRTALNEDVALARRVAGLGGVVRLVDGARHLACRPYTRLRDVWRGSVRNLQPVFFGSSPLLLFAATLLAALFLGPLAVLALGVASGRGGAAWTWLPLLEVALGYLPRALSDFRAGHGPGVVLLHPVAVAALIGISVQSALRFGLGRPVQWRGRRYEVRAPAVRRPKMWGDTGRASRGRDRPAHP